VRRVATRRLIDASATLNAPDQALLNIWVNRGLDDAALARMTGMSTEAIADRRARIVEHLSTVLGLPPEHIRRELNEIAASPAVHPAAPDEAPPAPADEPAAPADAPGANGADAPELIAPSSNGPAPPAAGETTDSDAKASATEPSATERSATEPPARSASPRRRPLRSALTLLLIVFIAVVVVVALISGGSGKTPRPAASSPRTVAVRPTTAPSPRPAASHKLSAQMVALAGGSDPAAGSIVILRRGPTGRLDLSVRNVPAALHGHYEVWLYNSLTYSQDLGRLRNGVTHLSLRLPADAGRYQWIDISFQPVGYVFHSGESILRSTNPLFAK
jgi:hypothetical protein